MLLPAFAATAAGILLARRLLHYFQLESYQFYGYSKTCLRRWKALLPGMLLPLLLAVSGILCSVIGKWVENGEYPADEKLLKEIVEDISYNNK